MKRVGSRALLVSGALSVSLLLPGCMIDRVFKMRAEMCVPEESFRITEADGVQVSFLNPVMHAGDVKWLTGVPPHEETYANDELTMRYIVTKADAADSTDFEVPIDMGFRKIDGNYKLAQLNVITQLTFDLSPEQINRMMVSACEHELSLFTRQVTTNLAPEDIQDLPERDEVFDRVGEPSWSNENDTELRYEFSIAGTTEDKGTIEINIEYDASGTRLLSMTTSYSRFRVSADFESGQVTSSLSL